MLTISGDIELNQGPVKFPCGQCSRPVAKHHRGVYCDERKNWFHIGCINITGDEYIRLSSSRESWVCNGCYRQENRQQQQVQHENRLVLQQQPEIEREHTKFSCEQCHRAVANNHRGVCCEQRNEWYHIRCANITGHEYTYHFQVASSEGWICSICSTGTVPGQPEI